MAKNIWDNKDLSNIETIDNRSNTKGPIWYNNKSVKVWQYTGPNWIYVARPIKGLKIYYNFNNFQELLNQDAFNKTGFNSTRICMELDLTEINLLSFKCINNGSATKDFLIYINSMTLDSGSSSTVLKNIKTEFEIKDILLNHEPDYPIKKFRFEIFSGDLILNFYIEIQNKISQEIKSAVIEKLTIVKDKYFMTF